MMAARHQTLCVRISREVRCWPLTSCRHIQCPDITLRATKEDRQWPQSSVVSVKKRIWQE